MADEKTCGNCPIWQKWDGDSVVEDVTKRRCWNEQSPCYWEWRAATDKACEAMGE